MPTEVDFEPNLPTAHSITVSLNYKLVTVLVRENLKSRFKVRDVLLGPI